MEICLGCSGIGCTTCTIDNLTFARYCRTDDFRRYVRDAVKNELFWKEFSDQFKISAQVQNETQLQVNNLVPNVARAEVTKELNLRLPNAVVAELGRHVPNYLDNNYQMQEILKNHSVKLNQDLEKTARTHLEKISAEDQYHEITKTYTDAITTKGNDAISAFNQNNKSAIDTFNTLSAAKIFELKTRYNSEFETFQTQINKVEALEKKVAKLENDNTIYGVVITGLVGVTLFAFFTTLMTRV